MDIPIEICHSKNICIFMNNKDKNRINNIKNIPKSSGISEKIKKYRSKDIRHLTMKLTDLSNKKIKYINKNTNQCHFTKNLKSFDRNCYTEKSDTASSYATTFCNTQPECKIKTVTFSTIEVIRIESYKKFNAINTISKSLIQKNLYEKRKEQEGSSLCNIF